MFLVTALLGLGGGHYGQPLIAPLGSFMVFFYVAYLLLWKLKWTAGRKLAAAAVLAFSPLIPLAAMDLAGFEDVIPHTHGVSVPMVFRWLTPGFILQDWLDRVSPKPAGEQML